MLGAMTTRRRVGTFPQPDQRLPAVKQSKPVPHAFVLEAMVVMILVIELIHLFRGGW